MKNYVIGVDYGSDSVRALLIDTETGKEYGESVFNYPRWKQGLYCLPSENRFRQHPLDYLEGLETTIKDVLKQAGPEIASCVRGIGVDTTGSTPCAVDKDGQALALKPEFKENPDAMFILWKDHTAVKEAEDINRYAETWGGENYIKYEGGIYSSEWLWAKILHTYRNNPEIKAAAYTWVELCDWIPSVLAGRTAPGEICRGRCSAGHKAMWHEDFNGLPPEEFFAGLDPLLSGLRAHFSEKNETAEKKMGNLTPEWAKKLGLSTDVVVSGGAFDCHMGAVGVEIQPYDLVKVIGTSTCDIMIVPAEDIGKEPVKGICGQVDGSVMPGYIGLEAGQSAFGDAYAWFKNLIMWPVRTLIDIPEAVEQAESKMFREIERIAGNLPVDENLIALDWMNGRRTPDANQRLKGAIMGLTLGTTAPRFYRSIVEATAFGARAIMERFISEGVKIQRIITTGGVSKKSSFVMQILADVMDREIYVAASDQACALGASMFAAVAAGVFENLTEAQKAMGSGFSKIYKPQAEKVAIYNRVYAKYNEFGAFVEGVCGGENNE